MAGRLFNEKEVSEILKRASTIRSGGGGDSGGITLEELQQTGSELGFDPAHIELAAQQLGAGPSLRDSRLGPRVLMDRTVDGEVNDADWVGMVAVIQRYHKDSGAVTQRPGSYDWAGSEEGASLALTVTVKNGRSRIRVESNRWTGLFASSITCCVLATTLSARLASHGSALGALALVTFFALLWFGLVRQFRRNHVTMVAGLMERLADEVGASGGLVHVREARLDARESASQEQSVQA